MLVSHPIEEPHLKSISEKVRNVISSSFTGTIKGVVF
jgi:hypothetical protein